MSENISDELEEFGGSLRVRHMVKARRILLLLVFIIVFSGISGLVAISGFGDPEGALPANLEKVWDRDLAENMFGRASTERVIRNLV